MFIKKKKTTKNVSPLTRYYNLIMIQFDSVEKVWQNILIINCTIVSILDDAIFTGILSSEFILFHLITVQSLHNIALLKDAMTLLLNHVTTYPHGRSDVNTNI